MNTVEAEKFLNEWRYQFVRQDDGRLLVPGNLDIARRNLRELPDLSCVIVCGNFYCQDNLLTSLKGAPAEVRGGFWCNGNQLETLEYSPKGVTGQYICHDNKLTSLKHAPEEILGDFSCAGNRLTSFEGAPKKFNKLMTGFGVFSSWEEVPPEFRTSRETKAAMAQDAVVLKGNMRVSRPLTLKKGPTASFYRIV
jgi:hypothetical protein